jgi:hypothetical protein
MRSNAKIPIERRRRKAPGTWRFFSNPNPVPMRRRSDVVRAQLQRWINLADIALRGKKSPGHHPP